MENLIGNFQNLLVTKYSDDNRKKYFSERQISEAFYYERNCFKLR